MHGFWIPGTANFLAVGAWGLAGWPAKPQIVPGIQKPCIEGLQFLRDVLSEMHGFWIPGTTRSLAGGAWGLAGWSLGPPLKEFQEAEDFQPILKRASEQTIKQASQQRASKQPSKLALLH